MPDSDHSNPDDPTRSGKFKAVTPNTGKPVATKIDVQEGTREHTVMVEQVPTGHAEDEKGQPDRRRQSGGMQVNVQPPMASGGLAGPWAIAGNFSAIVVIMGAFIWFIVTSRSDSRERWTQDREDRATERSQNQAAFAAVAATLTGMSNRSDMRDVKIDAAVEEIRRAVSRQESVNMEILSVLKSIRDAKNNEDGNPLSEAPVPRVKAGAG